jgi:hypothetical protein
MQLLELIALRSNKGYLTRQPKEICHKQLNDNCRIATRAKRNVSGGMLITVTVLP